MGGGGALAPKKWAGPNRGDAVLIGSRPLPRASRRGGALVVDATNKAERGVSGPDAATLSMDAPSPKAGKSCDSDSFDDLDVPAPKKKAAAKKRPAKKKVAPKAKGKKAAASAAVTGAQEQGE
eukprot:CAMPEP_0182870988 /NCGR_PEP_ID=MMETSP0034_2-20130328/10859_1 /TAXON_ID=156128 /ORGANISM="Nephroselmis pyriformis, Strain CCMP717" /LENGTH=122 /DNA_ID=CAMNT_0025003509 /DNA_START=44 /DNA_END=409 /DNA_ORIENTATION=-